jgi:hypothetical protein
LWRSTGYFTESTVTSLDYVDDFELVCFDKHRKKVIILPHFIPVYNQTYLSEDIRDTIKDLTK